MTRLTTGLKSSSDYDTGQSDKEQWQASNLSPVGLTEIFKAIPISKTAKRKVNKILNYFKHHFLADPKVRSSSTMPKKLLFFCVCLFLTSMS